MGDTLSSADFEQPKWYVLFVRSNQEKMVAERLRSRSVEHFLPCYQAVRQWKDRRVTLEVPLFPGYVFVWLNLRERNQALTVPNVVSLVGARNAPAPVSDQEINWIRMGIEHGRAAPYPYVRAGQRVLITSGVMAGMEGIVLDRRNGARVIIALDSIARAFCVEVDATSIDLRPSRPGDPLVAGIQETGLPVFAGQRFAQDGAFRGRRPAADG